MSANDDLPGSAGNGDGGLQPARHARPPASAHDAATTPAPPAVLPPDEVQIDLSRPTPGSTVARPAEDLFPDPGLPPHEPRRTDIDPRAARRAERRVAGMFGLATLLLIGFIAAYVGVDKERMVSVPLLGEIGAQNALFGLTLGGALALIGAGLIQWARKLMSNVEIIEERHPLRSTGAKREAAAAEIKTGVEDSRIGRRPLLIGGSLLAAVGGLLTAPLVLLRDLGPLPEQKLRRTAWADHREIVYENSGEPVRADDLEIGSMIAGRPRDVEDLTELAKASIFLIRMNPSEVVNQRQIEWGYEGIFAFSRICTHVGCPVHLYEDTSHHLLCPCHQSTFDMTDAAKVIFGPAGRPLPQLRITANEAGELVAVEDFTEPVGPSFWERG